MCRIHGHLEPGDVVDSSNEMKAAGENVFYHFH